MKEISDWIEETYLNFDIQENKDLHRSSNDFLQRSGIILRTPPKFICIKNGRIPPIYRKT